MALSTPIAFFLFNRPDLAEIVFSSIAKARPKKLFVVADGPRFAEEADACQQSRTVIEDVDWECEVVTDFSETNLGCKKRISSGLNWVFSEVEEAIILEDDCLPAPSFFNFCEACLDRYRDDERIMMVSGNNFQRGWRNGQDSYFFSKYVHIWGWATWRRAWQHYDVDMTTWPDYKKAGRIRSICEDPWEQKYWTDVFDATFDGRVDTWDYQWCYACWSRGGLSILPSHNLISNIGFGPNATHTNQHPDLAALPTVDLWDIIHPRSVARDKEADRYTFEHVISGRAMRDKGLKSTIKGHLSSMALRIKSLI